MLATVEPMLVGDANSVVKLRKQDKPLKISRKDSLRLWHQVTIEAVLNEGPDLSARQLAVMMSIYLDDGPHTVRSLASRLNVTKAVISRAVTRLSKLGFVKRAPDHRDKRSIILNRTSGGVHFLSNFGDMIQAKFSTSICQ